MISLKLVLQKQWVMVVAFYLVFLLTGGPLSAQVKVACIGDSITAGFGTQDRKTESYPAQLQSLLGKGYEVRNFGASGRTLLKESGVAWRATKLFDQIVLFQPNIVLIKLGTNDSKPKHWHAKDAFEKDYMALIDELRKKHTKLRIYLCLPAPAYDRRTWKLSSPGPYDPSDASKKNGNGIAGETLRDEVIPAIKRVAKNKGVEVIDLQTYLLKAQQQPKELFPDGVHPNKLGAKLMAIEVARVIGERKYLQGYGGVGG